MILTLLEISQLQGIMERIKSTFKRRHVRLQVKRSTDARGKPLRFELRRILAGDIEYSAVHPTKNFDYRTAEATFEVAAGGKTLYPHTVLSHQGGHAKQSRIRMN